MVRVFFLFFKQKTAYEVRISDWSSDVCSSDLSGCSRRRCQVVGGLGNDLYDAAFAMAGEMEAGVVAMPVWQDPLVVAIPARHPLLAHKQIGRASGRERVCQFV